MGLFDLDFIMISSVNLRCCGRASEDKSISFCLLDGEISASQLEICQRPLRKVGSEEVNISLKRQIVGLDLSRIA